MHVRSAQERVDEMASILDLLCPSWETEVDVETFDMSNRATDIAGQLGLGYDLDYEEDSLRGLIDAGLMPNEAEGFVDLNDAWMTAIFHRRTLVS